jgi:hypothetical protein
VLNQIIRRDKPRDKIFFNITPPKLSNSAIIIRAKVMPKEGFIIY